MASDARLANAFLDAHPEVAARMLETMASEHAAEVIESVEPRVAASVLGRMLPSTSALCAERLSMGTVSALLEKLPNLAGAALLRHFSPETRESVLARLGAARTTALRLLLHYPASAVGAWMEPRVLTFAEDNSTAEAAGMLEQADHAYPRIYVLDRARHVCGSVSGVALLRGSRRGPISRIVEPAETLWARESLASAREHDIWEHETEAPVVNRQSEFVGVVSYADLRKGSRRLERSRPSSTQPSGEIAELVFNGIEDVWRSLGELAREQGADRPRRAP